MPTADPPGFSALFRCAGFALLSYLAIRSALSLANPDTFGSASELIARRIIFTGGAGNFYVFLLHPMNYRRMLPSNMIDINRFG
jgi:hypothetical protein